MSKESDKAHSQSDSKIKNMEERYNSSSWKAEKDLNLDLKEANYVEKSCS